MKENDRKTLIDTYNKLLDYITLENVILMTYVIKNDDTFYTQLFLGEAFYDEKTWQQHARKKYGTKYWSQEKDWEILILKN